MLWEVVSCSPYHVINILKAITSTILLVCPKNCTSNKKIYTLYGLDTIVEMFAIDRKDADGQRDAE